MDEIIQLINGIGFPIAACLGMGWFIVWDKKQRKEDNKEFRAQQDEIYNKLVDSLNNNTKTINKLIISLERNEKNAE